MNETELLDNMGEAYALHKVIYDKDGIPVDYVFIKVNKAFERLTGLKAKDIINKKVTTVLPGIEKDPSNWIKKYGEVASKKGNTAVLDDLYSDSLKKWYLVNVFSPNKGFFVTLFSDITERHLREQKLEEHIRELDHMNSILIGRELRMKELKEEIADIRQEDTQ